MKEGIVLTAALVACCAAPQQHAPALKTDPDSVEVYRNLVSAELADALRSPENVSIAETFLAIDHLEIKGDEAARQGKSALAKAYYELALKNMDRWTKAFAIALNIWYIDNIMPEHAAQKPAVTPDAQKMLRAKMKMNEGELFFDHQRRLQEKIQALGGDLKRIQR